MYAYGCIYVCVYVLPPGIARLDPLHTLPFLRYLLFRPCASRRVAAGQGADTMLYMPSPLPASHLSTSFFLPPPVSPSQAMRESTRRIAAGEDADAVNESMMEAPTGSNRKARRASQAKKLKKK